MATANKTPAAGNAGDQATASDSTAATGGGAETAQRTPMPEPEGGWPPDEFTGKFGHYVRDPYTGIRSEDPSAPKYKPAA